jgi:endonuclease/exonuclease/phosphatase family metal-dependent hydrolase
MINSNSQVTIMFLNTWANRCKEELLAYIEVNKEKVDIFFFTEVTRMRWRKDKVVTAQVGHSENERPMQLNSSSQLIEILRDDYFCRYISAKSSKFECSDSGITFNQVGFGSLMALGHSLGYTLSGDTKIHNDGEIVRPRVLQWVIFEKTGVRYLAAHLHGVWLKENTKGDHPIRMRQSEQVLKALEKLVFKHRISKVIFGGDLNLAPDTEALAKLLSGGKPESLSRNLITEYGISSTRTPLYRKYNEPAAELLTDYVLTSENAVVKSFAVGSDVDVSDHKPLIVTLS